MFAPLELIHTWTKDSGWEATNPSGEAAAVVLLNGHGVPAICLLNICVYAHRLGLQAALAREVSFCGSGWWWLWQKLTTGQNALNM